MEPIYSVARVTGVTAWQSVNAYCHCCLILDSCVEVTGPGPIASGYSDVSYHMSKQMARVLTSVHTIPSCH